MFRLTRTLMCSIFSALSFLLLSGSLLQAESDQRPNVIVIMADDFGYECVGANGGTSYKTPVLDELAAKSIRFEHCYVQPLCTPTRVQLMTGIYNVRNYTVFGSMDPKCITFGNLFKQAGYATCIAGKWQLGRDVDLPKTFGFDESYLWQHLRRPERYKNPGLEINGVEKDWTNGEYGPDLVNEYAREFISRKKDGPFFLYYPMMLTHGPYTPTPDSDDYDGGAQKGKKARKKDRKNAAGGANAEDTSHRHFADMVSYADKLVGKLLTHLEELKIRDNTLVIFIGDNGTGKGTKSMLGDRELIGGKGTMTHRGMHVPLIASWPAKMKGGGRVSQDLIDSTDILPTICEAAGVPLPKDVTIDGHSFCPQLRGEKGKPRDWYYSWYAPQGAFVGEFAADRDYKLYRSGRFFDLRADLDEEKPLDVAALSPAAAAARAKLQAVLDQYQNARPPELAKKTRDARKADK